MLALRESESEPRDLASLRLVNRCFRVAVGESWHGPLQPSSSLHNAEPAAAFPALQVLDLSGTYAALFDKVSAAALQRLLQRLPGMTRLHLGALR